MTSLRYFFPLTKRARLLLKLDSSFREIDLLMKKADYHSSRQALECIFDILQLIERVEIKMELTREVDKFLKAHQHMQLKQALDKLNTQQGKLGEELRTNPSLVSLQKRIFQTSGACVFDAPSLHAWLSAEQSIRQKDLEEIYQPLAFLHETISTLMQTYNEILNLKEQKSENGLFHLHPLAHSSLICIEIPTMNPILVPEVSLSPKAIYIKLWIQQSLLKKNIPFNDAFTIKLSEY